ncbi:MAG: ABC transporter ATP-binding protein, partial [Thermoguttaceae bacterium]|nr:ABC transporter ATP-binding protein [Thermoguttaceae bacterium]
MILTFASVGFKYGAKLILDDVSFSLRAGEIITLLGPNGSGKTTLLRLAARFLRPKTGEIVVVGREIGAFSGADLARVVAYMPQASMATGATVFEAVLLGRKPF